MIRGIQREEEESEGSMEEKQEQKDKVWWGRTKERERCESLPLGFTFTRLLQNSPLGFGV